MSARAAGGVGVLFASTEPDGIEKLAQQLGIASQARALITTPLSGYQIASLGSPWLRKAAAGLAGSGPDLRRLRC